MQDNSLLGSVMNTRMLTCIFTGFASGLPYYVLIQLIPAWLRTEGVGLAEIGLLSLTQLPYTLKFIWAPLLDTFSLKILRLDMGLRRSWMFVTQVVLLVGISFLGFHDPTHHLFEITILCISVAVFSATFDISIDAFRRQILPDLELGLGNSIHVNAYRISSLIPGSLSLMLADLISWNFAFVVTSAFFIAGIIMTLFVKEPQISPQLKQTGHSRFTAPFLEFFSRNGMKNSFLILLFMLTYKLGDSMATSLATPFYIDLGFSLTDIGLVAKNAALWTSIIGGILGGIIMIRIGINKALWIFGLIQIISILGFAILARVGENLWLLGAVVGFEYLGVGLGTAAFIAYIAKTTSKAFAATQFALFTALTAVPRTTISASSGYIVELMGWEHFFYLCTALAVPGMILLLKIAPWDNDSKI